MTVYFTYRTHYDEPSCFHNRQLEAPSILEWFQSIWRAIPEPNYEAANAYEEEILGCHTYGFSFLFNYIHERSVPPPQTMDELVEVLKDVLYYDDDEVFLVTDHTIQVLTDDDEIQLAFLFFDDHFHREHPERTSILVQPSWELPTDFAPGPFEPAWDCGAILPEAGGNGKLWAVFLECYDSYSLEDIKDGFCLEGARLPDFAKYLGMNEADEERWQGQMLTLEEHLLVEPDDLSDEEKGFYQHLHLHYQEATHWDVYSDWLIDQDQLPMGQLLLRRAFDAVAKKEGKGKSCFQVSEHMAQLCLHAGEWKYPKKTLSLFHRWIFFDDLWAAAHPDLANSMLCSAHRWDPLTI